VEARCACVCMLIANKRHYSSKHSSSDSSASLNLTISCQSLVKCVCILEAGTSHGTAGGGRALHINPFRKARPPATSPFDVPEQKNGMHLESKHWMEDCSSNLNDESLSNLRDQAYVYTVQTINETTLIPCFGELGRTGVEMQILK